jgi:hypothetical protein
MSSHADTKWRLSNDGILYVSWVTNIGHFGLGVLSQESAASPSKLVPLKIRTWKKFKDYAIGLEHNRYIFRGHSSNKWRLRTAFHRTERSDLRRFIADDIPTLHRYLSGLTSHYFHLADPQENAAFYALAQHHGYPTPLLDWTLSPFVAAYFAYRGLTKDRRHNRHKVRILIFDVRTWRSDFMQLNLLTPVRKHFSLLAPLAINNNRMAPQQAVVTISNVDDIESYIKECEGLRKKTYLTVVDLPGSERQRVMKELAMMGITAGSMFPGLDGACEHLKEQNFDL